MGIGTPWKAALLLAVGAAGGAAAIAVASVPDGSGVIHACVALNGTVPVTTSANVRVIDPGAGQTCSASTPGTPSSEATVAWNVKGPPGQNGAPGKSVTIPAGNTLTLAGGQVVTVGRSPTLTTIVRPLSTRTVATLSLNGGVTTAILSFSFAATAPGTGSGKSTPHDIQVTKSYDKSSTKLSLACVNGAHFKHATISFSKGTKHVTYTMSDVIIGSYQLTGGKGGKLLDDLTLSFAKLTIKISK